MFYVVKNGGEQILYSTSSASISARRWELLDIIASSPNLRLGVACAIIHEEASGIVVDCHSLSAVKDSIGE